MNYKFNYKFYTTFYPDIKIADFDMDQAISHYNTSGIKEKRVCCEEELKYIINTNLLLIKTQHIKLLNFNFKNVNERKLNILIRTSMRPEHFKLCIESILTQKYENYCIFVCYDKIESLSYLNLYKNNNINLTTFFINNDSNEKYKFNLYNNELMNKVDDGFIIFLDDDDVFSHNMCFKIINEYIINEDSILIWKFMRPDKLVYPKHINDIKIGEIDTTMICFHNKYKNLAKWGDKKCGDYYFYNSLFTALKDLNKFNITKLNYVLTKTNYLDKLCNSFF